MADLSENCVKETITGHSGTGGVYDCSASANLPNTLPLFGSLVDTNRYPCSIEYVNPLTTGVEHGWGTWDNTLKTWTILPADILASSAGVGNAVNWNGDPIYISVTATAEQLISAAAQGGITPYGAWEYKGTSADVDPGSKRFKADTASLGVMADITEFYFSDTNQNNVDVSTLFNFLPIGGSIYLQVSRDADIAALFTVDSVTDNIGYSTLVVTFVAEADGGDFVDKDKVSFLTVVDDKADKIFYGDVTFLDQINSEIVITGFSFGSADTYVAPSIFATSGLLKSDPLNFKNIAAMSGSFAGVVGVFSAASIITPDNTKKGMLTTIYRIQGRRTDVPSTSAFYSCTAVQTSNFHTVGDAVTSVYNSPIVVSNEVNPGGVVWTTPTRAYQLTTNGVASLRNQVMQQPSKTGQTWYWEIVIETNWVPYV